MNRIIRRRAFTLIEVMIVVMIITVLLEIAVPNFLRARTTGQRNSCMENLKQIDSAKEQWAMENGAPQGAIVQMSDIGGVYVRGPATGPICPAGGSYTLNPIGENPVCTLAAAPQFHILPY